MAQAKKDLTPADYAAMDGVAVLAASKSIGTKVKNADKKVRGLMPEASVATFHALRTGILSLATKKDRPAGAMGQGDYADMFGKSSAYITLTRRCGTAIVMSEVK